MVSETRRTVGVAGLGEMGKIYARIAQDAGCVVVGTDVNERLRTEFEESVGGETFENYVDMYDEVDAAIITIPNKYHEKAILPALEQGLDLYVEKPLAHDYESAERIVDTAADADSICMVSYSIPLYDLSRYLDSAIDRGELGEIMHIEARNIHRRHVPRQGSWYTAEQVAGGGVLQDKGSFVLDMLFQFGFGEIDTVTAVARNEFDEFDDVTSIGTRWAESEHGDISNVEDSMTVFLQSVEGNTAVIETAWATNAEEDHSYVLRGTDGGARLDVLNNELAIYESVDGSESALFDNRVESVGDDSPRYHDSEHYPLLEKAFGHFLDCLEAETSPEYGTLSRSLRVQRAVDRIYDAVDA